MLSLHCIRDLTREKVANFFRSSLILEVDERLRLLERATDCFSKFNSDFSLAVLEDIEVEALNKLRGRLMKKIKIGREGWVEEGRQEGIKEVALRMIEKDMSVEEICSITKLSHSAVNRHGARKQKSVKRSKEAA